MQVQQVDPEALKVAAEATVELYRLAGPVLGGVGVILMTFLVYEGFRQWRDSKQRSAMEVMIMKLDTGLSSLVENMNDNNKEMRSDHEKTEIRFLNELKFNRRQMDRLTERNREKDVETLAVLHGFKSELTKGSDGLFEVRKRLEIVETVVRRQLPPPSDGGAKSAEG